jgi:hypothetical protein
VAKLAAQRSILRVGGEGQGGRHQRTPSGPCTGLLPEASSPPSTPVSRPTAEASTLRQRLLPWSPRACPGVRSRLSLTPRPRPRPMRRPGVGSPQRPGGRPGHRGPGPASQTRSPTTPLNRTPAPTGTTASASLPGFLTSPAHQSKPAPFVSEPPRLPHPNAGPFHPPPPPRRPTADHR